VDGKDSPKSFLNKFDLIPIQYTQRYPPPRGSTLTVSPAQTSPERGGGVKVFVAGSDSTRERTNHIMRNNFRGTIDKVGSTHN